MPAQETQETSNCDMARMFDLGQCISTALSGALVFMRRTFKLERKTGDGIESGGWSQFLQEKIKAPTVTGTACIITSMMAAGESRHSEYVRMGKRLIIEHAREDGGWSKPSLKRYYSLTLVTCLALRALLDADQPSSSVSIQDGVRWLLDAQNPDGGWGNLAQDQKSDVTSTAYALRVLTRTVAGHPDLETGIERGHKWLVDTQNADCSWGRAPGDPGSLPYVSHAVEGLLACGVDAASLAPVRDWVLANIPEGAQFIDHYVVELPDGTTERLIWTHLTDERSLIALLRLGADITSPVLERLVGRILAHQVDGRYWRVDTVPRAAPSWAMVESILALRLYLDRLEHQGSVIALSRAVAELQETVAAHAERIARLEARVAPSFKVRLMGWLGLQGDE